MSLHPRRTLFLLVLAALLATALLAIGLPGLRLSPGLPLPSVRQGRILVDGLASPGQGSMALNHALLWILAAGGCVLGLHALWRGLRGARLATVLAAAARGLLVLGGICLGVLAIVFAGAQGPAVAPAERPVQLRPPPARTPLGDPPPLLLWLVAGGVLLASAGVAAWMLRPSPPRRRAVDDVALEAQRAREALLAGEDPRTVILACYARMSRALAEERGIERPESMTAREFGALLGTLGIPHAPVQELTRLFEAVRYGGLEPGAGEEARAVACLGAIVQHCRAAGERA